MNPHIFLIAVITSIFFNTLVFSQDNNGENDKYEIDEINIKFSGSKSFDESELLNLLASREGDVFDMPVYILDVERLRKFYFDNGFFDAKVDTNIVFNTQDKEVIENFTILQNSRYKYYDLEYIGLDTIVGGLDEKLFRTEDKFVREGRFYSKDSVSLENNRVFNILLNNGYATATSQSPQVLKYETNIPSLKDKVKVQFVFEPKLRYVFGTTEITLKGKRYNVTKEDIARELTYSENQIYNKEEVLNSELNLTKISILDNPRINIDKVDTLNKKVYLKINAVIGNKYDLTPEVFGYHFQNLFYIGAGLSFTDKYFFGGARVLTTRARFYLHSLNDNRLEFVNTVYQPFLFNNRNITGNWNVGAEYRLNEDANITQIKNTFGIAYDLPSYTYINRLTSKWDVQNTRVIYKKDFIQNRDTIKKADINIFTSTIGFAVIHNSVNNIQFPFAGNFQSYEIQESGLLGNIVKKIFNIETFSFVKFTNFNAIYKNLSKRDFNVTSALGGKFLTGILIEYGDNQVSVQGNEISADKILNDAKFICGGSSSVRGWGARQLGIVTDKQVGGNFIIETTLEHRVRPFLDVNNTIIRDLGFATFVDAGNVWSEISKIKLNEFALAAGAGIRYYTIIGAIRFDIGFKIYDPQPGPVGGSHWLLGTGAHFNDKYNLQFGIGNTF